jgi:hypothetical protein
LRNSAIIRRDSASLTAQPFSAGALGASVNASFALSDFAGGSTIDFPLLTPIFGLRLVQTY